MASLIGDSSNLTLQNPTQLLDVSFIVPMTFIPILVFYEFGGELFDFETSSIPFLYVNPETCPAEPSPEYGRIGLTAQRLRALVYAFGIVNLKKERLEGKIQGENTCFGEDCTYKETEATRKALEGTKVIFGPQFNLFFHKNSTQPQSFHRESYNFVWFFRILLSQADKFIYFVSVPSVDHKTGDMNTEKNMVQFACPVCDEDWVWRTDGSNDFAYNDSRSFWNGIHDAVDIATSKGTKLHWAYDYINYDTSTMRSGQSCKAYAHFLNQQNPNNFALIEHQFVFSLFPLDNSTELGPDCDSGSSTSQQTEWRFSSKNTGNELELSYWKTPETFDEAFMFITDQNVSSKRYAADLYLKAFDVESWIAVLVAGGVTCCALAMLVKTSKMKMLSGFWASMRYLGAYFTDQSKRLPFPDAAVRSKMALLFMVVPWMMAMLILSNGFRGVMKSNYVINFPYETSLQNWRDFKNLDLFTFVRNVDCTEHKIRDWTHEAWIWWAANGRQSKDWCYNDELFYSGMTLLSGLPRTVYREQRIDEWLHGQKLIDSRQQYVDDVGRLHSSLLPQNFEDEIAIGLLCVGNFSQFSGKEYHENVDKWNQIALKGPANWNLTFRTTNEDFQPCDSSLNYTFRLGATEGADTVKAFWMTRRHESAFVIRMSEFPWYWNLFKKAMVNDSRVQFAHTGGAEVMRKSKRALYERNDSPYYVFVKHRYMEPANWMIRRIAAIQESGIFNLWYKWDMILRPPVKESLNDEVSETFDEVRELRLSDPGITFLVNVAAVLLSIAVFIFALEVSLYLVIMV